MPRALPHADCQTGRRGASGRHEAMETLAARRHSAPRGQRMTHAWLNTLAIWMTALAVLVVGWRLCAALRKLGEMERHAHHLENFKLTSPPVEWQVSGGIDRAASPLWRNRSDEPVTKLGGDKGYDWRAP